MSDTPIEKKYVVELTNYQIGQVMAAIITRTSFIQEELEQAIIDDDVKVKYVAKFKIDKLQAAYSALVRAR